MRILVDADALPTDARQILQRAAARVGAEILLVANKPLRVPDGVTCVVVAEGYNVADDWIAERVQPGDLVVTADVPLAGRAVEKGACALDPRGYLYTEDLGTERSAIRDLKEDLRNAGLLQGGGPAPFSKKDAHKFANALDAWLTKACQEPEA